MAVKEAAEEPIKPAEVYAKLVPSEIPLANTFELIENYFDGLSNYLLLKVKEGAVNCYIVASICKDELMNLFILPAEYLQVAQANTSVILRVAPASSTEAFDPHHRTGRNVLHQL